MIRPRNFQVELLREEWSAPGSLSLLEVRSSLHCPQGSCCLRPGSTEKPSVLLGILNLLCLISFKKSRNRFLLYQSTGDYFYRRFLKRANRNKVLSLFNSSFPLKIMPLICMSFYKFLTTECWFGRNRGSAWDPGLCLI